MKTVENRNEQFENISKHIAGGSLLMITCQNGIIGQYRQQFEIGKLFKWHSLAMKKISYAFGNVFACDGYGLIIT